MATRKKAFVRQPKTAPVLTPVKGPRRGGVLRSKVVRTLGTGALLGALLFGGREVIKPTNRYTPLHERYHTEEFTSKDQLKSVEVMMSQLASQAAPNEIRHIESLVQTIASKIQHIKTKSGARVEFDLLVESENGHPHMRIVSLGPAPPEWMDQANTIILAHKDDFILTANQIDQKMIHFMKEKNLKNDSEIQHYFNERPRAKNVGNQAAWGGLFGFGAGGMGLLLGAGIRERKKIREELTKKRSMKELKKRVRKKWRAIQSTIREGTTRFIPSKKVPQPASPGAPTRLPTRPKTPMPNPYYGARIITIGKNIGLSLSERQKLLDWAIKRGIPDTETGKIRGQARIIRREESKRLASQRVASKPLQSKKLVLPQGPPLKKTEVDHALNHAINTCGVEERLLDQMRQKAPLATFHFVKLITDGKLEKRFGPKGVQVVAFALARLNRRGQHRIEHFRRKITEAIAKSRFKDANTDAFYQFLLTEGVITEHEKGRVIYLARGTELEKTRTLNGTKRV